MKTSVCQRRRACSFREFECLPCYGECAWLQASTLLNDRSTRNLLLTPTRMKASDQTSDEMRRLQALRQRRILDAVILSGLIRPLMDDFVMTRTSRKGAKNVPDIASASLGEKLHLGDLKASGAKTFLHKLYNAAALRRNTHQDLRHRASSPAS
jgi:hypothetical protein